MRQCDAVEVTLLHPSIRSNILKHYGADFKIDLVEETCNSILCTCIHLRKKLERCSDEKMLLPKNLGADIEYTLENKVYPLLDVLEAFTYQSAWYDSWISSSCYIKLKKVEEKFQRTLHVLNSTILNLCPVIGSINVSCLKRQIDELMVAGVLNQIDCIDFSNKKSEDWDAEIGSMTRDLRKISLNYTDIQILELVALANFKKLEVVKLRGIKLPKPECWIPVINALSRDLRELDLGCIAIGASGLLALEHLNRLEKINLSGIVLEKKEDWSQVISCLSKRIKEIGLSYTNIDKHSLIKLFNNTVLEELDLTSVNLYSREDWKQLINCLPKSVNKVVVSHTSVPWDLQLECIQLIKSDPLRSRRYFMCCYAPEL